jgi:hypothetical protein
MSANETSGRVTPRASSVRARTWGTLAALVVIGLSVNMIVSLLTYIQFAPLVFVAEYDQRIYQRLWPPPPVTVSEIHPVIVVDVDNASMSTTAPVSDTRTPRALLAQIVRKVRDNGASSVFIDIDLREAMKDDDLLNRALSDKGPPVLVPRFFTADATPACDSKPAHEASRTLSLTPNAIKDSPNAISVHALLEPGAFGIITGELPLPCPGPDSSATT